MENADELAFDEYVDDFEIDKNKKTYTFEDIESAFLNGYNTGFVDGNRFKFNF